MIGADISKCFDSITHAHLRSFLDLRSKDGVTKRMFDKWLKAGVLEEDALHRPVAGVDPGTEPGPHISDGQFLDPLPDSLQNVGETCLNPLPSPSRGLRLDVSFGDGINREVAYRPFVPVRTVAHSTSKRQSRAGRGRRKGVRERTFAAIIHPTARRRAMRTTMRESNTFLTHTFGQGLEDERYAVERFKSAMDGEIRPMPAGEADKRGSKGCIFKGGRK